MTGLVTTLTRWTVYGRRRADVRGKPVSAGVHAEKLDSLDAAMLFLTSEMVRGGHVEAVIVQLDIGVDDPHMRRVVHRVGEGRAWWE